MKRKYDDKKKKKLGPSAWRPQRDHKTRRSKTAKTRKRGQHVSHFAKTFLVLHRKTIIAARFDFYLFFFFFFFSVFLVYIRYNCTMFYSSCTTVGKPFSSAWLSWAW